MNTTGSIAILTLGMLGGLAAIAGGASPLKGAWRVCFWGTLATGLTALVGTLVGISVRPQQPPGGARAVRVPAVFSGGTAALAI